jgi:O-antigen ligase
MRSLIIPNVHQAICATILLKKTINFRLAVICMVAASVGLSMAIVSIAKLLLILFGLATLLLARREIEPPTRLKDAFTPVAVLAILFAFSASLFWTVAPQAEALGALAKYGKLIVIVLLMMLIRERREAMYALGTFVLAQTFLLASSWMLFAHIPVPWATSNMALTEYAVFSSYLDQGIISAVFSAICWHFRSLAPGRFGKHLAVFVALAALCNVFFILNGRSGHVIAIALLSIAIMWELPKRFRTSVILMPFLLVLVLFFSSTKVRDRLTQVQTDLQSYSSQVQPTTSSGVRLELWRRAIEGIAQRPFAGTGAGSWNTISNRLQREKRPNDSRDGYANPHQEYLLWGVQFGIPGILMLFALMFSVLQDSKRMEQPYARATQSALLALAIACLFNSSIYDALIGDFFCVLLGLLLALGLSKTESKSLATIQSERTP